MRDNLEKQHLFLVNYKNLIHVKNELFGKQDTCNYSEDDENKDKISVNNIERCLQHCQLKYIDFLRVLNDRYEDLSNKDMDKDKKKAIMFDIIALEKQISTLSKETKGEEYKLKPGALIKINENGDIYLGIVKSHKNQKTNVLYCNKIVDPETDTQECKNVREIIYNKDKEKEIVIPILDFIKYYKNIAHISNPIIKKGFVNDENYEDYDVETYRNMEQTQISKNEFIINKNTNIIQDLGMEKQKIYYLNI